ncbi:MAG: CoA transferase [Chloroflexi bacterium]|nr:CoA transferase [Chloroflexota bacterium]
MPLPLEGIRVCDLTQFWAGPFATQYLANLGAEVIKIEPAGRGDRQRTSAVPRPNAGEWVAIFNGTNVNKHGCTLDITTPEGKALLRHLISISDVVAMNMSARAVKKLGLEYDYVRSVNPTVVMLSMTGFGATGPWQEYVGFGPQFEQASGITYISGYPDLEPMGNPAMGDPIGGTFGAIAIMMALSHRRRTGQGQFIDLATTEGMSFINPYALLDYTMNGRIMERNANKHRLWSPHGAFPCKGHDEWVAIAVQSDAQFAALCACIGRPELAAAPRFADALSRWENEAALREPIAHWSRRHTNQEAAALLQQAGVPSGATVTHATVIDDPQLKHRDFFWWIDRPINEGKHPYYGFPAQLSKTPVTARKIPPTLGEDNAYVYGDLLSLASAKMADLDRRGVIAKTVP